MRSGDGFKSRALQGRLAEVLVGLQLVDGEPYLEAGLAGLGLQADEAAVFPDDALHDIEPKA